MICLIVLQSMLFMTQSKLRCTTWYGSRSSLNRTVTADLPWPVEDSEYIGVTFGNSHL